MGLRRAFSIGVVAAFVLAGCGGSSDKTSTAATAAKTSTSSIASHVLRSNELEGFTVRKPAVANTVRSWLSVTEAPPSQIPFETKRLNRLGFVAGAHEDLTGPDDGVSIAEQFKTPAGARAELDNEVTVFKTQAAGSKTFTVSGIPGAVGLAPTGAPAANVAFTDGDYYYLVGAFVPALNARSEAKVTAAAKRLYRRVHG
jgi:hypothetical protein